ncbi:hypothetical protein G6F56_006798 [Rhizopus delemar]|nr:hypothetical protein G6F56_006798 [Rhizopus delemar]
MFQSSSSRREHYLSRPVNSSKHTLHKKHFSLESKASLGADSGYNSLSSTPACSIVSSPTSISAAIHHEESKKTQPINKKRHHQSLRPPDLVYSCPRPLAFPFHNDDHFLPVAEADPRDVARVTPSLIDRSNSIQSKISTQYDADSSFSRQSSILSSIQRGTVRSIRSIFQLPNSLSNISQSAQKSTGTYSTPQPSLERLEIKKGTVQSLKALFSSQQHQQEQTVPKPVSPLCTKRGQVGTALGQSEANRHADYSRAQNTKTLSCTDISNSASTKKSLSSRASELAKRAFWKKSPLTSIKQTSTTSFKASNTVPISPATKPLPKQPTVQKPPSEQPRKTLKSEVKKLSARVLSSLRPSKDNIRASPSKKKDDKLPSDKKDDKKTSKKEDDKKNSNESDDTLPEEPSKVGKLWKSFKNLMARKKSSRVGVL